MNYDPNSVSGMPRILEFQQATDVPSSETQGQSVGLGKKAGRKFSCKGGRAPGYRLSSEHLQKFKRMLAPDCAQKMLCIIVPKRRIVSSEFFSWVRTRRLLSRHSCPVRSPSLCVQGKLLFSTFLTRNKGTTDESKKRLGYYQQEQLNLPREYSVFDGSQLDAAASYIDETGRKLSTRLTEHKRAMRNGDVNNHIAQHHLQTKHQIDWDSATCFTYSTDYKFAALACPQISTDAFLKSVKKFLKIASQESGFGVQQLNYLPIHSPSTSIFWFKFLAFHWTNAHYL